MFHIQNSLKQRNVLSPLYFTSASQYAESGNTETGNISCKYMLMTKTEKQRNPVRGS